jgi:uncharacterized protein YgiM (DUF1202 family)
MKKLLIVLAASIFLGGCSVKNLFVKAPSGLEITTTPASTVFLNGENLGPTPYINKELKAGTYSLKLVPTSGDNLAPYETNLVLVPKASTIISRTFAPSDLDSSGYTLQLQEDPGGGTYLSVISDPDNVNVTIDGKPSGFSPLSKLATGPGSHALIVTSPGYVEQSLPVNAVKGYNLIINFKLASQTITLTPSIPATSSATVSDLSSPAPSASGSARPSSSPLTLKPDKPYVLIGETGTGWLRVRKDASGTSQEIGKANTGEALKYLGESTDLGWHKVDFDGAVGWVSGKYTTLVK